MDNKLYFPVSQFESVPTTKARVKVELALCVFLVSRITDPCFLLFNVWKLLLHIFVLLYCYWLQEGKSDTYYLIMAELPENFWKSTIIFPCAILRCECGTRNLCILDWAWWPVVFKEKSRCYYQNWGWAGVKEAEHWLLGRQTPRQCPAYTPVSMWIRWLLIYDPSTGNGMLCILFSLSF